MTHFLPSFIISCNGDDVEAKLQNVMQYQHCKSSTHKSNVLQILFTVSLCKQNTLQVVTTYSGREDDRRTPCHENYPLYLHKAYSTYLCRVIHRTICAFSLCTPAIEHFPKPCEKHNQYFLLKKEVSKAIISVPSDCNCIESYLKCQVQCKKLTTSDILVVLLAEIAEHFFLT